VCRGEDRPRSSAGGTESGPLFPIYLLLWNGVKCGGTGNRLPKKVRRVSFARPWSRIRVRREHSTPDLRHSKSPADRSTADERAQHLVRPPREAADPPAQEPQREADGDPRGDPAVDRAPWIPAEHARDRGRGRPQVAVQRHPPAEPAR